VSPKGYRFKGHGEVVGSGPVLDEVIAFYAARGDSMSAEAGRKADGAVMAYVERASQLVSPGYAWVASEQEMRDHWIAYWRDISG
jgi:hypothetical protein